MAGDPALEPDSTLPSGCGGRCWFERSHSLRLVVLRPGLLGEAQSKAGGRAALAPSQRPEFYLTLLLTLCVLGEVSSGLKHLFYGIYEKHPPPNHNMAHFC